jgi:4-diphosphocytidyl-2-C-methyl-D-erythritol kinase
MAIRQLARAKVNLTLKVLGRRGDGYHQIESLVTFAAVGDRLRLERNAPAGLAVGGPFAGSIAGPNILEAALTLMAEHAVGLPLGRIELDKNLPVAAGLGGGSSDAAALLRMAQMLNPERAAQEPMWRELARRLGADVPVCLADRPALMRGVGEDLELLPQTTPPFAPLPAVLVNPQLALATGRVFQALGAGGWGGDPGNRAALLPLRSRAALFDYMRHSGNDLERTASDLAPIIGEVKAALLAQPGCQVAAMSGSGPTCFGIFANADRAAAAAAVLGGTWPGWWIVATELEGVAPAGVM